MLRGRESPLLTYSHGVLDPSRFKKHQTAKLFVVPSSTSYFIRTIYQGARRSCMFVINRRVCSAQERHLDTPLLRLPAKLQHLSFVLSVDR